MALRYDKNAGVREKALHGLEPYVAEDTRVRDAVLEALMSDGDSHIRTRPSTFWDRWRPTRACGRCCIRFPIRM